LGFSGGSEGKESACIAGHLGLIPGLGRSPGEWNGWLPTPVFCPGEFHGQRNLAGYSPWCSPSKNTGQGCHFLLQGIFPTLGLNLGLLNCRWILY